MVSFLQGPGFLHAVQFHVYSQIRALEAEEMKNIVNASKRKISRRSNKD
jgi:hypothetical protein